MKLQKIIIWGEWKLVSKVFTKNISMHYLNDRLAKLAYDMRKTLLAKNKIIFEFHSLLGSKSLLKFTVGFN